MDEALQKLELLINKLELIITRIENQFGAVVSEFDLMASDDVPPYLKEIIDETSKT